MISCLATVSTHPAKNSSWMLRKRSSSKSEEPGIILLWLSGQGIMRFYKEFRIGDGEVGNIRKIIINYFRFSSLRSSSMRVHISLTSPRLLSMESATMEFRGEVTSTTGLFGQAQHPSKATKPQSANSTHNSVPKPFQFGRPFSKAWPRHQITITLLLLFTRDTTVDSIP